MELFYDFKDLGVVDFFIDGFIADFTAGKSFLFIFLISKRFRQIKKKVGIQIIDYLDNFILFKNNKTKSITRIN